MNLAIMFNQHPIAEERIIHFHKCNVINVRDFSGPTCPRAIHEAIFSGMIFRKSAPDGF